MRNKKSLGFWLEKKDQIFPKILFYKSRVAWISEQLKRMRPLRKIPCGRLVDYNAKTWEDKGTRSILRRRLVRFIWLNERHYLERSLGRVQRKLNMLNLHLLYIETRINKDPVGSNPSSPTN